MWFKHGGTLYIRNTLLKSPTHCWRPQWRWFSKHKAVISVPKYATVANLSSLLRVPFADVQRTMKNLGYASNHWDFIVDGENAVMIAEELGVPAELNITQDEDLYPQPLPTDSDESPPRPPVVALMGHVDHGKTTLLDHFRKSQIVAGEKGGITQHIGAFLTQAGSHRICFLDTPGHEAFLKLRQRGAHLTDIVLLVVASDDSVMPQTKEAIKHANAAGVPMIVALTKIDRADAKPERVVADLAREGVDVEEFGGDTQCIPVSAVTGKGIADLQAALQALIEVQDPRGPIKGYKSEGVIVESSVVKGVGPAASMIVRKGVLKPRQVVVAGTTWCRVRQLMNDRGKSIKEAHPGTPVRITGWKDLPDPGDIVLEAEDENQAKRVVENRKREYESQQEAKQIEVINENRAIQDAESHAKSEREERAALGLENNATQASPDGPRLFPFVVKADVVGSAEAVTDIIGQIGNDEVQASVLYSGVGPVSESDVFRAETANASIIAFSTNVGRPIERLAEQKQVTIMKYDVIYKAMEDVSAKLSAELSPIVNRRVTSTATVRAIFSISLKRKAKMAVAGVKVSRGTFTTSLPCQVLRNEKVVHVGQLSSIRHGKDQVLEAHKGSEYGFTFKDWTDFKEGDVIEGYEEIKKPRYL